MDLLKSYADLGIDRVVVAPPSNARHPAMLTLARLDEFANLVNA